MARLIISSLISAFLLLAYAHPYNQSPEEVIRQGDANRARELRNFQNRYPQK